MPFKYGCVSCAKYDGRCYLPRSVEYPDGDLRGSCAYCLKGRCSTTKDSYPFSGELQAWLNRKAGQQTSIPSKQNNLNSAPAVSTAPNAISTSNPPPRWPSPRRTPSSTTTSRKRHRLIPYQCHQYRLSSFKPRSRRPPSQSLQTSPHHRWEATRLLPAPKDLEAIRIRDSTPPKRHLPKLLDTTTLPFPTQHPSKMR